MKEQQPEPDKCLCGEPSHPDLVVHRTDGPCYMRSKDEIFKEQQPAAENPFRCPRCKQLHILGDCKVPAAESVCYHGSKTCGCGIKQMESVTPGIHKPDCLRPYTCDCFYESKIADLERRNAEMESDLELKYKMVWDHGSKIISLRNELSQSHDLIAELERQLKEEKEMSRVRLEVMDELEQKLKEANELAELRFRYLCTYQKKAYVLEQQVRELIKK